MDNKIKQFIGDNHLVVSKQDEDINITYTNNTGTNTFGTKFSVDIKDNMLDATGLDLINQNPDFFKEILQDKKTQEGKVAEVNLENIEDIRSMEAIADIAIDKGNVLVSSLSFNPENMDIEVKEQGLINIHNNEMDKMESFYNISLDVDGEDLSLKYKIGNNPSGHLDIRSETEKDKIYTLIENSSIPLDKMDDVIERVEGSVSTELSIYEEEIIANKFEDDLGLANEEMANEVFVSRNKIAIDDIDIVYEEKGGKKVPMLQSKAEFFGKDINYHPDNVATFSFPLSIDGNKVKPDGSNISVDVSDNSLSSRSVENKKGLDKLISNNIPYQPKEGTLNKMLVESITGRRVNDGTHHSFEDNKKELVLESGLKEKVDNNNKKDKKNSVSLSM